MKRPLPPIVISFCCGLIAAHYVSIPFLVVISGFLVTLAVFLRALFLAKKGVATLSAWLLFFITGIIFLFPYANPQLPPDHIIQYAGLKRVQVEGIINEPPRITSNRTRFTMQVTHVHTRQSSSAVRGQLLVSIKKSYKVLRYGDRIRFFCYIRKPQNFENPGSFDYVTYLAYQSVFVTGFLKDDREITILHRGEGSRFLLWVESYRESVRTVVEKTVPPPGSDILKALILGEKGTLPEYIQEQFVKLGIAHVLAISGLHIGIVSFIAYLLFTALLRAYHRLLLYCNAFKLAVFLSIIPVGFYCFLAGFHVPTLRAFIMIAVYMAALLLDRKQDLLSTLFLAAFVILILIPPSLFEISFQLSFAAVLALIVILPAIQQVLRLPRQADGLDKRSGFVYTAGRILASSFIASAAAILGTAPLLMSNFHRFSFLGFFANIILVPFVGFLIVPLGLLATAVLPLSAACAQFLFAGAGMLVDQLLCITSVWSRIDWAEVTVAAPAIWEVVAFYVFLYCFPLALRKRKLALFCTGILCFLLMEVTLSHYRKQDTGILEVTFIDVGKGDAAIMKFPGSKVMLIDGGGFMDESFDVGRNVVAPLLYSLGIKKVDFVVLSHPHRDHIGGLPFILENFDVAELWLYSGFSATTTSARLLMLADIQGVTKKFLAAESGSLWIEGVRIDILSPAQGCLNATYADINNNSLVLKIVYGSISFLFTGDILADRESMLVSSRASLLSTVLKVPHHGRTGSSTPAFVRAVSPKVSVVSCRSYGKAEVPSPQVLHTYRQIGAQVYRTDMHGAVFIKTDGTTYTVKSWKK